MYRTAREIPLLCLRLLGNRCPEGMEEFGMGFYFQSQLCPALLLPWREGISACTTAFGCTFIMVHQVGLGGRLCFSRHLDGLNFSSFLRRNTQGLCRALWFLGLVKSKVVHGCKSTMCKVGCTGKVHLDTQHPRGGIVWLVRKHSVVLRL